MANNHPPALLRCPVLHCEAPQENRKQMIEHLNMHPPETWLTELADALILIAAIRLPNGKYLGEARYESALAATNRA